jgi:hypothetical protein
VWTSRLLERQLAQSPLLEVEERETLSLSGRPQACVQADKAQSCRATVRVGQSSRELQRIGSSQIVNPQQAPSALAQRVGRLYLLPSDREAIQPPSRSDSRPSLQKTVTLKARNRRLALDSRSPPRQGTGV